MYIDTTVADILISLSSKPLSPKFEYNSNESIITKSLEPKRGRSRDFTESAVECNSVSNYQPFPSKEEKLSYTTEELDALR